MFPLLTLQTCTAALLYLPSDRQKTGLCTCNTITQLLTYLHYIVYILASIIEIVFSPAVEHAVSELSDIFLKFLLPLAIHKLSCLQLFLEKVELEMRVSYLVHWEDRY